MKREPEEESREIVCKIAREEETVEVLFLKELWCFQGLFLGYQCSRDFLLEEVKSELKKGSLFHFHKWRRLQDRKVLKSLSINYA